LTPAISVFLGLDAIDTARVVDVSRIFLIGIVGHSIVELFVRSFYAFQQPKYPLIGAVLTLILFILFGITLTPSLQASGIALSNTLAYTIQAVVLLFLLNSKLTAKLRLTPSFLRALLAALVGGALAFGIVNYVPRFAGTLIGAMLAGVVGLLAGAIIVRKELVELKQL